MPDEEEANGSTTVPRRLIDAGPRRVEDCFAQLGRWRRISRSYEATAESATTWLHVACIGYMLSKL